MQGTVAYYTRFGGYGFIIPDDPDAPDYFVHFRFIDANPAQRFLKAGQRVEFTPVEEDGRPQAHHVTKIGDAPKKNRGPR